MVQDFHARFGGRKNRLISVVEHAGRRVVDWECYSRHSTATYEELITGLARTADVRVFMRYAQYYNGVFGDDTKYRCLVLTSPDWSAEIYGYVERGSVTGKALFREASILARSIPEAKQHRVTLRIESRGESHETRQFFIARALDYGWVRSNGSDLEERFAQLDPGELSEEEKIRHEAMERYRRANAEEIRRLTN